MTMQHKSFPFSVKAVDDAQGIIEAYGSVFEVEDQGGDIVRSGAFTRTINNSKSRVKAGKATYLAVMLWQHDPNTPIGGWTELKEDHHGLLCKGQIILTTQQGREAYELIKSGVIQEFSIGYDIPQGGANYDSKDAVRNLTELRLWEVSPVTFAMNDEALLVGVKAKKPMDKDTQKKTLQEHFDESQAQDLLEDWQDIYVSSLTSAILDACKIGDALVGDISTALDDFKALVMSKFVPQAAECDLPGYLSDNAYSPADYTMQNGSSSYGYMSRHLPLQGKAGRAISAANADKIQSAADALNSAADAHEKAMKAHLKTVRSAADDLATVLQGSEAAYGTDAGTPEDNEQEGKAATSYAGTRRTHAQHSSKDTVDEAELSGALSALQSLRN